MAEKPVKVNQPEKARPAVKAEQPGKARSLFPARAPEKDKEKDKTQPKQPNRIVRWYRETLGELRKVSWPTLPEARRLTTIVLIVMGVTALFLGALDFLFSRIIAAILV